MLDVVLVHAFPLDARLWSDLVERPPPGTRVHAPDLPGFGANREAPVDSIDAMADAVEAFVRARGLASFVLGGLSMGGYVALSYLRRHPQNVRALVLADTRADADSPDAQAARDETLALLARDGTAPVITKLLSRMFAEPVPPAVLAAARRLMQAQPVATVAAATRALRSRPDATDLLAQIGLPTLVLCGDHDVVTPPALMQAMAARLRHARYAELPNAGHLAILQSPEAFRRELEPFLAGLTA